MEQFSAADVSKRFIAELLLPLILLLLLLLSNGASAS